MFPVVDIAAADTGPIYGDEGMVWRIEFGFRTLLEDYIKGFIEDEGEILQEVFVSGGASS